MLVLGKVSGLQQGHPESCRQSDTDAGLSFLSHTKLLLTSLPWSTPGPFQHYRFPRVFSFHDMSVFWIISPQMCQLVFFHFESGVLLSSLETFSRLYYFSDLPSSVSELIPLQSSTTSAALLCLHRGTVLNGMWHFMKPPSVQVRTLHTKQASQSGK